MRGLRLNLLTNTPYLLIIYAVQRKIYYTEEVPSCPVLFLFFLNFFGVSCKSNFTELNACEPRAARFGTVGPGPAKVCVRLPAKPLISVFVRKPRDVRFGNGGLGLGKVCVRFPAKPLISVFVRKPRAARFGNGGPGPAKVCVRLPAMPLISVFVRKPRAARFGNGGPGPRPVCSPLPARPYAFVSGSKIFTQLPAEKHSFAGARAARFAPRSPLSLMPSFRGANSSHKFRPESIVSPAAGPPGLLPAPR